MMTLNNPTDDERHWLEILPCCELIAGEETGEQGTVHIHAFICFNDRLGLQTLKHLQPRANWRPVQDRSAAILYVTKGHVVLDRLEKTGAGKSRTRQLVDIVLEKGLREAMEEDPYLFHKNRNLFLSIWSTQQASSDYQKPEVTWIWGETGSGKTYSVYQKEPQLSRIVGGGSQLWFDSYKPWIESVLFDDFRGSWCELSFLLQLLDEHPIDVPVKGGFIAWRPKRIYITSPFHPRDAYPNVRDENMQQLLRRIDHTIEMKKLADKA